MGAKVDYIVSVLQAKKDRVEQQKAAAENEGTTLLNDKASINQQLAKIQGRITSCNQQLTTLDQAIAKIQELDA